MDSYYSVNYLHLDSFDSASSIGQDQGSDSCDIFLSPLTLTRLQQSWHNSQHQSDKSGKGQQSAAESSDNVQRFTADSKALAADFGSTFTFLASLESPEVQGPATGSEGKCASIRLAIGTLAGIRSRIHNKSRCSRHHHQSEYATMEGSPKDAFYLDCSYMCLITMA